ncbi:hypothetical protein L1987_47203 [Smallanthus sonchifolius]|uniref:Uncharacterized protein n=1 Tax=Smallanthus sonchifolius TaxID=185202 RepID=A0ACB9G2J3_9ASTR|nr:hypothetical protein L1987_47203 [Smallanthus sonchifolius]
MARGTTIGKEHDKEEDNNDDDNKSRRWLCCWFKRKKAILSRLVCFDRQRKQAEPVWFLQERKQGRPRAGEKQEPSSNNRETSLKQNYEGDCKVILIKFTCEIGFRVFIFGLF